MSLIVIGSIGYDTLETPKEKVENALGGSAIYFGAASSLFVNTNIVGVVGKDYKMSDLDFLKERGSDISGIKVEDGETFRWSGKYHKNMNDRDTVSTDLNVLETFNPVLSDEYKKSEYVFLANLFPALQSSILDQVENPKFTALDTMNFWIEGARPELEKVMRRVDCIIMNDSEALDFADTTNYKEAARFIAAFGPKIVIIKKGEHGAVLYYDGTYFVIPALLLDDVFDPTGAGDSFAGGFMGYIAEQDSVDLDTIKNAMAYGTCTASFCCEKFGPQGLENIDKIKLEERLKEFKELISLK